ncbi:glycoside hydrolase family 3 N-terminal domain-containing protein [Undibacterium sp. SXout20W]|uniref:glycoside hydrolase family 3 protein n=1 Tax=Undibacterium sp. SXout20W TaxID=3413051 RepID=UPI003BF061C1
MKKQTFYSVLSLALLTSMSSTSTSASDAVAWPKISGPIQKDPKIEAKVQEILASMTLAQKIGQMTQPEIKTISPKQVSQYYIGSVLNGGGSWPHGDKYASVNDWVKLADEYYEASMNTGMKYPIPVVWGIDAIHGNSNIYGATLFPHNAGLGAAHDPQLIKEIGTSVAKAVRATGINWVFAPTVAVNKDPRWGRSYESFSSDPALVKTYAFAYVSGLQSKFEEGKHVIATAKHFIGDGGTDQGIDQGVTKVSEADLLTTHGQGYLGAMAAGVQTVMASYNSWVDTTNPDSPVDYGKMHGNKKLLNDVLKEKMGFDGFVISDWNAIGQLPGCTNASCALAINAGVDMIMVPDDWQAFIKNTIAQVNAGEIPVTRIDDAVSRILRVKLRAGLFGQPPSASVYAGKAENLQDRALARRAVRESLVLLKNDQHALPLKSSQRILVVGKNADSLVNQTGGWSITWQGADNVNRDFPNGDSILDGILKKASVGSVVYSPNAENVRLADFDAIIAVVGETPYAEGNGDIGPIDNLKHSLRFPEDLAVVKKVSGHQVPVITVFVGGHTSYLNDLINLSSSFVVAWLPGTEGGGVADVLYQTNEHGKRVDFTGKLSFSWPGDVCPSAQQKIQFERGYGLNYTSKEVLGKLPEVSSTQGCGNSSTLPIYIFNERPGIGLTISSGKEIRSLGRDLNAQFELPTISAKTVQVNTQQDAKLISWNGKASFYAATSHPIFLSDALKDGFLQFDIAVKEQNQTPVLLSIGCGTACENKKIDLSPYLKLDADSKKKTLQIPLACFVNDKQKIEEITQPFLIETDNKFAAAFANIKIRSKTEIQESHVQCH